MQVDTNWYWNQHPQQHVIVVPTRTILHPRLEVTLVTYFLAITKVYVLGQKQMVYGELHIYHSLVLNQNANDNTYSIPLHYEVWNVDHKIRILGIDLC